MKILFLAHRVPYPPDKGDKIRAFHEMCALFERGHDIHLFAFADDLNDLQYQVELSRYCSEVRVLPLRRMTGRLRAAASLAQSRPLSVGYYASQRMRKLVDRAVSTSDFDAVLVYSSTMAQYAPASLAARTVVDLVDVDSEKWRDYSRISGGLKARLLALESERLRRYEYEIIHQAACTFLSSSREASLLDELDEFTCRARLRIMTNGVDTEYFHPWDSPPETRPCLVFTGVMNYLPNVEGVCRFVEQVWPLIRAESPEADFVIVGRNPVEAVRKLATHRGVSVTGEVDDVRPYLRRATVMVAPLNFARGVQNKVLEAMAMRKPVVATPAAVAGLRVEDGIQVSIAQSPQAFASAVVRIINDRDWRESLADSARSFVEREHQWPSILQPLLRLIESFGDRQGASSRLPVSGFNL